MEGITRLISNQFGTKFDFLRLKNVQVFKPSGQVIVTLFYPCDKQISEEEKQSIKDLLFQKLEIENLRIKIVKSYLEASVIKNDIYSFITQNHKLVSSSIKNEDIEVRVSDLSVYIKLTLASRTIVYFENAKLLQAIKTYLEKKYIADFYMEIIEDENRLKDVDLDADVIFSLPTVTPRYEVESIKKIAGKEIAPRPEYIKNIKGKKNSVILGGIIENFKERSFTIKKGKKAGEQKAFFTFDLNDGKKIESIIFSNKANYDNLSKLENGLFVYGLGNVEYNKYGTLCYHIKDLYLARVKDISEWEHHDDKVDLSKAKQVVKIEKMETLVQDSLFGKVKTYDDTINGKTIVVYDLETTGLDTDKCEIIEIGAVKIVDGAICERFETLVKPTIPIPKDTSAINHITDDMVENAPSINTVIIDFYKFVGSAILAGHNIIGFDNKVLFRVAETFGLHFNNEILDTLIFARRKIFLAHYTLGTLAKYYKVPLIDAHRAWNDAYANAQVLLEMCRNDGNVKVGGKI